MLRPSVPLQWNMFEGSVQDVEAALRHMGSGAQGPFVSSFNIGSDEWDEALLHVPSCSCRRVSGRPVLQQAFQASQTVCGIVFRELWSSDQVGGMSFLCCLRSLITVDTCTDGSSRVRQKASLCRRAASIAA